MNTPQTNSKNVLNSDVELKGNLKFTGELTFDGKLEGDINSEGSLNLGDNAVVKGNINVSSIVMRGKVNGNVIAKDKVDIKSKTELFGDVRAPKLAIEEGVTFVGKTEVNPNKVMPIAPPTPPLGQPARNPEPTLATSKEARQCEPNLPKSHQKRPQRGRG